MDVEIHLDGAWHPCARVELVAAAAASRRAAVRLQYEAEYALTYLGAADHHALTVRAPIDLGIRTLPHWPSFLVDLLPQGAARKRIERQRDGALTEWELLERGAANPVGNLRIPRKRVAPRVGHPGFALEEMVSRGDAFVDHATEVGATVAGATDTQGEAPKYWVVEDDNGRWHPDTGDLQFPVRRYRLLKFPVPESGPHALDILRHEAVFQRIARALGLRVTDELPEFLDDAALSIPRFDRRYTAGKEVRLGVESLYSIAGVLDSATATLRHHEALIALARCVTDLDTEVKEYVRRDLLNIALGNRDNHGRNTAVLKETDGTIQLAPLYDFGPAFLDARALARVIRWDGEEPAATDWNVVLENLATYLDEAGIELKDLRALRQAMRGFADDLASLPELMRQCGADEAIIGQRREPIAKLARELRTIDVN